MTTWTPVTGDAETTQSPPIRVFDRLVFDNAPIFDTGSPAGIWIDRPKQPNVWTEA